MDKYKIAIVIPAFNEETTISKVVQSVKEYGIVIVVNDASSDKTQKIAEAAGALVINHKSNQGYDKALNSGFKKASELNCNAIISFDADGQHSAELLSQYIDELKKGIDLVLGVRPNTQRFAEKIFKLYTQFKFKWNDPLCGMKGYTMELYRNRGWFDSLHSIGTELAMFGILNNYKVSQINIPISTRNDNPRFASTLKANIVIFKALFNLISMKK